VTELEPVVAKLYQRCSPQSDLIFFGSQAHITAGWGFPCLRHWPATGSVANIIVVERARGERVRVGFHEYFCSGLPVTLATLVLGSVWLWLIE
jgi:hypothetical protein